MKSKLFALALAALGLLIGLHRQPAATEPPDSSLASEATPAIDPASEDRAPAQEAIPVAGASSDRGLRQDGTAATEQDAQTPVAAVKEHPFPGVVSGGPGGYTPPQPVSHTFQRGQGNACLLCGKGIMDGMHPVMTFDRAEPSAQIPRGSCAGGACYQPAAAPQQYQYQRRGLLRWRGR